MSVVKDLPYGSPLQWSFLYVQVRFLTFLEGGYLYPPNKNYPRNKIENGGGVDFSPPTLGESRGL